jgi:hypothetical protein
MILHGLKLGVVRNYFSDIAKGFFAVGVVSQYFGTIDNYFLKVFHIFMGIALSLTFLAFAVYLTQEENERSSS